MRLLLVRDDRHLADDLAGTLSRVYAVDSYVTAELGYYAATMTEYDVIVLDLSVSNDNGIDLVQRLRKSRVRAPIIALTDQDRAADRVRGLDAGADDYVSKPFSPTELVARIRAVLRRIRPALADEALSYADIVMDLVAHRVTRGGKPVHLGPTEFRLLRHFMEHPGRVFAREQLLDSVWGKDVYVEARTVDVHIRRLRIALNGESQVDVIRTVRAAGYALDAQPG